MRKARKSALAENLLLAALPVADRRRLLAKGHSVELVVAGTVMHAGEQIRYVYFPIDCVISLIASMDGRMLLGVGLVGNEGVLGTSLVLGVNIAPLRAVVQGAGLAWRLDAATFARELERSDALSRAVSRYLYVQWSQLAQTVVCTRFHFIEARVARWLLMTRDRSQSNQFHVTHEVLAYMLGVRRVGVTRAASALRARQLIRYTRGELEILDAPGLEAAACECYATAKSMYASVLG